MGLQWRPITCLVIQVDGLNRWWAQVHLLRGCNVGEGRVSYDVSTVDPAAAGVERTTVRHFVAQVRERVELKQTVVSCGVEWRGLIEDECQRSQPKGRPNHYTKDNFEELPWVGFEHMSLCSLYFRYVWRLCRALLIVMWFYAQTHARNIELLVLACQQCSSGLQGADLHRVSQHVEHWRACCWWSCFRLLPRRCPAGRSSSSETSPWPDTGSGGCCLESDSAAGQENIIVPYYQRKERFVGVRARFALQNFVGWGPKQRMHNQAIWIHNLSITSQKKEK